MTIPDSSDNHHTLSPLFTWRSAICDSELEPGARLLAQTLACHMSVRGDSCFPSINTLSAETGMSDRSVQRYIRRLRQTGWLTVTYGGGRGRSNRYKASVPKGCHPVTLYPERVTDDALKGDTGGARERHNTSRSARTLGSDRASFAVRAGSLDPVRPDFTQRGGCDQCEGGWILSSAGLERCAAGCWE